MNDPTRIRIGRAMASIGAVSAVAGVSWLLFAGESALLWEWYVLHNAMAAVGFGVIAWLVLPSQPRNRAVWALTWGGFLPGLLPSLMAVFIFLTRQAGITEPLGEMVPTQLPLGPAIVGQQMSWPWVGIWLIPTLMLLTFPDGQFMSSRWRRFGFVVGAFWLSTLIGLFLRSAPWSPLTYQDAQELTFLPSALGDGLFTYGYLGMIAAVPLCVLAMITRLRRSSGVERQQLRWISWGALVAGPFIVVAAIFEARGGAGLEVTLVLLIFALLLLVVPIGIAIGRYKLYEVDIVINRTVVFAVLVGFVAIIYGVVVVGLGSLIGGGGEGWTPILATAVVALAFEPVRHTAQRWANRLAYGHRATPYEILADLTERLTASGQEGDLLERMARLLMEGTGAERATVWLGEPGAMRPEATAGSQGDPGEVDLAADSVFSVLHDGEVVGALEVVKSKGTSLSSQEVRLMADLAGSAGAVLGYRRLNESLARNAREIERSRRRLVEAEDEERRRLEQELNEGAQQQILALKVSIGLAQRAAAEAGSEVLAGLLGGLADETQAALEEVRNLAKGIYPPVLESDGLGPAVSALASGSPVEVEVSREGVGRYPREVEAAVYFDVSEALTNAVKHAHPPIRIELSEVDGILRFSVSDSGPGFDPETATRGSGLENLYDRVDAVGGRLEIVSIPGSGTTVAGEIPL